MSKGAGKMLRVALAGAGMISHHHMIAWAQVAGEANVVAICDPDMAKARQRAREFGIPGVFATLEEALASGPVDAVDIASPRETHSRLIELAASRGIDVLCQKPLARDLAEASRALRSVNGAIRIMVHENWRFRPWYRQVGAWMDGGELGDVHLVSMEMFSSGLLPDSSGAAPALVRQPFMANEKRLMVAEVLIHHLDVVRWLFGPLRVIHAHVARTCETVVGESQATIVLQTGAGVPVIVSGSMAAPGHPPATGDRLHVVGSKASVFLDGTELRLMADESVTKSYDFASGYQASFDGVISHFVSCLADGAPFETDAADNIETLRLVEHAYWAAGYRPS